MDQQERKTIGTYENNPGGEKCKGMEGLNDEGEDFSKANVDANKDVLDAGLIATYRQIDRRQNHQLEIIIPFSGFAL